MSYQVPQHIDKNKIFIVKRSEIEGRLEPEFYSPSIFALEKKIRSLSSHKLSFYAKSLVGGATPLKSCSDEYYSNEKEGISFLRVQNLQSDGNINLSNCLYINTNIHNGLLKRSQVNGGDLLVKITGVGRMAVASVAPKNFVGNTNQHMVVIKTNNESTSKYLSRYLNLDIIEKIASRHSTGGTRPALDYPSLKAILIIENIDFSLIDNALYEKQHKEAEAQKLLDNIDGYILNELEITMPKIDSCNNRKIFTLNKSELSNRYDPYYFQDYFKISFEEINKCSYPIKTIKELSSLITSGITPKSGGDAYTEDQINIRSGNIDINGKLDFADLLYLRPEIHNTTMKSSQVKKEDLLIAIVGATIGQVGIYLDECEANINQAIALVRLKSGINVQYVKELIKSSVGQLSLNRLKRPVACANINLEEISTIKIPLPPLAKQQEIVDHITALRHQAAQLQQEGKEALEKAKQEVEEMILGK